MKKNIVSQLPILGLFLGCMLASSFSVQAQQNSVVQIHADKSSGYGVAYGGPQNLPDRIVTALHVVAGKSQIAVMWQGKSSYASIEKIYKAADLALLKLQTPLGIPPLALYSGNPPWDTNVQFWEIPVNTQRLTAKTTVLDESTSLSRISPRVANNAEGLSKALCQDGGQYYPGMATEVINFKEPNIRKAHSGSPLTYDGKIIGLVDGGANLVGGKSCVWAIPSESFLRLFSQGTPVPSNMQSCGGATGNKFMYSGMRSDNPFLTQEEYNQAADFESASIPNTSGLELEIYHEYRMGFEELYESMFPEDQDHIDDVLDNGDDYIVNYLLHSSVDIYTEGSTGVSIMVPTDAYLMADRDENGTYLATSSPGGSVSMHFYITPGHNMDAGMQTMSNFKNYMHEVGYNMTPHPNDIEDYRNDDHNPYYSEYVTQEFYNDYDELEADFTAEIMINAGDFLAIIIQVSDWDQLENNPEELAYLYLMEACAQFSDFSYY